MWEDPALDPVPPGHGERENEGTVPRSVPPPPGHVPPVAPLRMCPRCFYCHPLDQECER